jgi:hypothetical protein
MDKARQGLRLAVFLGILAWSSAGALAQAPTVGVTGGLSVLDFGNDPKLVPGVFTWGSKVELTGSHWPPFETLSIHLVGPLNTPGLQPVDREVFNALFPVNAFSADEQGNLHGRFGMPFGGDISGSPEAPPDIVPPGRYTIYAVFGDPGAPGHRADSAPFTVVVDSIAVPYYDIVLAHSWGTWRGGRDGWLQDHSPERTDPEWITVWSKRPVALYGTVAATNMNGGNQPAIISYQDFPTTHYAHDADVLFVPDDEYKWVLSTANFVGDGVIRTEGRIEWEWETQNDGSPFLGHVGAGNIGLPLWAMPTVGDRLFTVGHWALDNGHPDHGDKSEIHPARMIATLRKRTTVAPLTAVCMTRAAQVDIYVSGHGGGANQYYDGLEDLIDNEGRGGGRVRDLMTPDVDAVYERFGPNPTSGSIDFLLDILQIPGIGAAPTIYEKAGPSALATDPGGAAALAGEPWVIGPEERPINDMDYDFDVPLPPAPAGATRPLVQVTQHPEHTTQVSEVITYTGHGRFNGLPTAAHVHLPYNGADNGIYARTLNFYWDTFSRPGNHYQVTMIDVKSSRGASVKDPGKFYFGPQPLYLWTDVSGQWDFLTRHNANRFLTPVRSDQGGVDTVGGLGSAKFDVYLQPDDTLRVFTYGYAQRTMDYLFGQVGVKNAYDGGIDIAVAALLDTGDDQDVGGALFDASPASGGVLGAHSVSSDHGDSGPVNTTDSEFPSVPEPVFTTDFDVTSIPEPGHVETQGSTDLGGVCLGSTAASLIQVVDSGDTVLGVSGVSVSGGGYSAELDPPPPYNLIHGSLAKVVVRFSPTDLTQGAGTLTVTSDDACAPALAVPLTATVLAPQSSVTPALHFGILPVGDRARNSTQTQNLVITSSGVCPLVVRSVALTDGDVGDFAILAPPAFPATLAPGDTLSVPVRFNPRRGGHRAATISVTLDNDPAHPVPMTIVVEGGSAAPHGTSALPKSRLWPVAHP